MLSSVWAKQPLLSVLFGSALFWPTLFHLLSAFGHPLSHDQQDALSGLGVLLGVGVAWTQVSPTNTPINPQTVDLSKVGKP